MENDGQDRRPIPHKGWKLRFDAPPGDATAGRAAHGDILALFRAWDGADRGHEERRRTPRYTPAETRAWVGWWRSGHFLVTKAELVNLSQGGALMRLAQKPPIAQPVWICLGAPTPVDSVQGRVLDSSASTTPTGEDSSVLPPGSLVYVTRLEFHSPCPSTFFLAAGWRDGWPKTPVGNGPAPG